MKKIQKEPVSTSSPTPNNNPLAQILSKGERTYIMQYSIIKQLRNQIHNPSTYNFQLFRSAYTSLSPQIKKTLAHRILNYQIWNNEELPVQIREHTQFFSIISQWIITFEMKVTQLTTLAKQFNFLADFFQHFTTDAFQRIVLLEEIYEDLLELLGHRFWGIEGSEGGIGEGVLEGNKEEAAELLKLLGNLIEYYQIFQSQPPEPIYNTQLYLLRHKTPTYKTFILQSLHHILSVNNPKKAHESHLQPHQEMQLTRLALIFLQRPDIEIDKSIKLLQALMLRTSKVVRYAMVVDYVRFYGYLQNSKQYDILQQLQNMVYFRELVIGHSQISQAGLSTNYMANKFQTHNIAANTKSRILVSHQQQFGKYVVLQLEVTIQGGDINLILYKLQKNGKQIVHWRQDRTEDRRVDILLNQEGLYMLEMDNTYSWIKSKQVGVKVDMFCVGIGQ